MKNGMRMTLLVVVGLVGAAALLWTGFFLGRSTRDMWGAHHPEMMSRSIWDGRGGYPSWDRDHMGPGMMKRKRPGDSRGRSWIPGGGMGMMDDYRGQEPAEVLSVEEAHGEVNTYLASFQGEDLAVGEIMVFDNHAYAIVVEESTGIGAFELLIDPVTGEVTPEPGPNMMWNVKYGMRSASRVCGPMGRGMMGGYKPRGQAENVNGVDLAVSEEEALQAAQEYLDEYSPGVRVTDEITRFYGYYTIDVERDGDITGMLSVNGYTAQVFPHTWHGEFVEMSEGGH